MKLHPEKAYEAVKKVADKLEMDVIELASGAYDIINAHMLDLMVGLTVRRGYNPEDFVLFSFGGCGPSHLPVIGAELGVKEIIIPREASTYSALGIATAELLHTHSLFDYNQVPMAKDKFNRNFELLEERVLEDLEKDKIKEKDRTIKYFLTMKYGLQLHEIRIAVPRKRYSDQDMEDLAQLFDRAYEDIYGKGAGYPAAGRIIIQFIVQGMGRVSKLKPQKDELKGADASEALKGQRRAFFRKYNDFVDTNIYDYDKLQPGNEVRGPVIVEATKTTIVVMPDQKAFLDEYRNMRVIV